MTIIHYLVMMKLKVGCLGRHHQHEDGMEWNAQDKSTLIGRWPPLVELSLVRLLLAQL
jgi:hypothetical protein